MGFHLIANTLLTNSTFTKSLVTIQSPIHSLQIGIPINTQILRSNFAPSIINNFNLISKSVMNSSSFVGNLNGFSVSISPIAQSAIVQTFMNKEIEGTEISRHHASILRKQNRKQKSKFSKKSSETDESEENDVDDPTLDTHLTGERKRHGRTTVQIAKEAKFRASI